MALRGSSVVRHSLDQPGTTLSYLDTEEVKDNTFVKNGDKWDVPETAKTEKVHLSSYKCWLVSSSLLNLYVFFTLQLK